MVFGARDAAEPGEATQKPLMKNQRPMTPVDELSLVDAIRRAKSLFVNGVSGVLWLQRPFSKLDTKECRCLLSFAQLRCTNAWWGKWIACAPMIESVSRRTINAASFTISRTRASKSHTRVTRCVDSVIASPCGPLQDWHEIRTLAA